MELKELKRLQLLKLEDKEKLTKQIIKQYLELNNNNCYFSYSGGKDSSVLRRIGLEVNKSIPSVFCDTTNEQKEILEYVAKQSNITTLHPKMGFMKILKVYGFPMISKMVCRKLFGHFVK